MVLASPWGDFLELITSESSRDALALSLRTSAVSTLLCVVLGVPMAVVLARTRFPGQSLLRSLVLLPLVLPPVVGGIALLYTFGRRGLLGETFEVLGIQIAFSTTAVVLAQTFVALPFLVVSLEGALRTAGQRYEVVAASLGARPTTVLRRVTLPLVLPGLVSGAVLAFARALGEFGATITFAGSLQGVTRTLPLEIYLRRETDAEAAVALSLVLVVVAVLVIGLARQGRSSAVSLQLEAAVDERGVEVALEVGHRGDRRAARAQRRRQVDRCWLWPPGCCPPTGAGWCSTGGCSPATGTGHPGARAAARAPRRAAGPGPAALPAPERRGQRRLRAPQHRAPPGARPATRAPRLAARGRGRPGAGRPTARRPLRRPGTAGRGGPGPGRRPRGCCCSTSRWPPSTSSHAPRCARPCVACSPTGPWCS